MGREFFLTLLSIGLAFPANTSISPTNLNNGKSYSLLAFNAEGFDFRDENNNPIAEDKVNNSGLGQKTQELFLESAWNLLVLNQAPPRILVGKALSQSADVMKRLFFLVKKVAISLFAIAVAVRSLLERKTAGNGKLAPFFGLPTANCQLPTTFQTIFQAIHLPLRL